MARSLKDKLRLAPLVGTTQICDPRIMKSEIIPELQLEDYERILNIPSHIVVVISRDGFFLKSNKAHQEILGWDPPMIVGQPIDHFIHEDDVINAKKELSRLFNGAEPFITAKLRCRHRDGGYRTIGWRAINKDSFIYAIGTDATRQAETEEALVEEKLLKKEYQKRFETFFEQSVFPMQIFSKVGKSLVANQAWEIMFDTNREELSDYNILQDMQVKKSSMWESLQQAYSGEVAKVSAHLYDPKLSGKVGRARWIESWISPVKDDLGQVTELAIIHKDVSDRMETQIVLIKSVSERKAAEEKIRIMSDRLSMAVKAGNIGIWEWIPNTNHIIWDETTENIYGYDPGTFPKSTSEFNTSIHPEDRKKVWTETEIALKEKKSFRIDHRIIRLDGAVRWVQSAGMAFFDEKGNAFHVTGTVMDISDRVEAEADQKFISEASELLSRSLDSKELLKCLGDHAINYFCDGAVIDQYTHEGELKRLMVVHRDQEVVEKIYQMSEDFSACHDTNPAFNPMVTGEPLLFNDQKNLGKEIRQYFGEGYFKAISSLGGRSLLRVRLKGRESILGVLTFFTSQKSSKILTKKHIWLAEELAYRLSMALENASVHQKSKEAVLARDEFLSVASHELKTPLQSLTLQNQMRKRNIMKGLTDAFDIKKVEGMIDSDLKHLLRFNRLIDDMLDISRIRAGKLNFINQKIDFCSFVTDVLERFRPQLDSVGCFLTTSLCPSVTANIDIYRIEQVIVNLLTNAMKYGAGRPIKVVVLTELDLIQLEVHDQGPGIKQEDSQRIFERFERAISSNEVSGLGLGLYISRQIMEQNNGSLAVTSSLGQGSTFIMQLPAFSEKPGL